MLAGKVLLCVGLTLFSTRPSQWGKICTTVPKLCPQGYRWSKAAHPELQAAVLQGTLGWDARSRNVVAGSCSEPTLLEPPSWETPADQPGRVLILYWSQLGFIDRGLVTDVNMSSQSSKGQTKTNRSLVLQNFDLKYNTGAAVVTVELSLQTALPLKWGILCLPDGKLRPPGRSS